MFDLELAHREEGDRVILTATGELDVYTSPTFHEYVRRILDDWARDYPFRWVCDFSALEFLDSAGLGTLMGCLRLTRDMFRRQYEDSQIADERRTGPMLSTQGEPIMTLILPPNIARIFFANGLEAVFAIEVAKSPSSE